MMLSISVLLASGADPGKLRAQIVSISRPVSAGISDPFAPDARGRAAGTHGPELPAVDAPQMWRKCGHPASRQRRRRRPRTLFPARGRAILPLLLSSRLERAPLRPGCRVQPRYRLNSGLLNGRRELGFRRWRRLLKAGLG
jgi:hypothetical protein